MPWEPLTLLRGVREVSTLANPNKPTEATQAAFDAARARNQNYAALPRAKRITEQLGLRRWARVLEVAHEPENKHAQLLGWKTKDEEQDWLTEDYIASVLRLVAHRLGKDTLTLLEYGEDRSKLLAADKARWLHGRQLLLPKPAQIEIVMGSWSAALRAAGLKTRSERDTPNDPTHAPTHASLLDLFWQHYKVLPLKKDLLAFARGNGIPYPYEGRTTFGQERAAWIKARRAAGETMPDTPPPRDQCADYSRNVGAALPGKRTRASWTDPAACIAVVQRYLSELPPGKQAGAESYRAWAKRQTDATPAINAMTQHGGWTAVRKLAQEELRREQATSPHDTRTVAPSCR